MVRGPFETRALWSAYMSSELGKSKNFADVVERTCRGLSSLPSALGYLHGGQVSAPLGTLPRSTSSDIFPLSAAVLTWWLRPEVIAEKKVCFGLPGHVTDYTVCCQMELLITALNYLFSASWDPKPIPLVYQKSLSRAQEQVMVHRLEAVLHFLSFDDGAEFNARSWKSELSDVKMSYGGEAVLRACPLVADKVLPAWPDQASAASLDITHFVSGEILDDLLDPSRVLLPESQWPLAPKASRVHASDDDWYVLCQDGLKRGLFSVVRDQDVFRDGNGVKVTNGAMAVPKQKKTEAGLVELQRFICVFCPINQYLRRLRGCSHALPYVGRCVVILLGDGDTLIMDSSDIEGCSNLVRLPAKWLKYFCFEKMLPASIIGGDPAEWIHVAMNVLPMGLIFSVDVMQRVARTLAFKESEGGPADGCSE